MPPKQFPLALWLSILPLARGSDSSAYVAAAACAQCHRAIATTQAKMNMAQPWRGVANRILARAYRGSHAEGPAPSIAYRAVRNGKSDLQFETALPGRPAIMSPVEAVIGGERHGVSFLMRIQAIEGAALARAPLVEARYLHSTHENGLALAAGFPEEKPSSYETALGRALSPSLEKKCLDCHGRPDSTNTTGGIHCESCHGPGRAHLDAVAAGKPRSGIVNPARLTGEQALESCGQCHSGFSALSDPLPADLLVSNQVNALKNSPGYIQTRPAIR